ncbi:MAG TPA: hypothetical protein VJY62_07410, partial [Bacteroidia bacterium]|nr:hypothetical protein [Bacteroidia bacterium]
QARFASLQGSARTPCEKYLFIFAKKITDNGYCTHYIFSLQTIVVSSKTTTAYWHTIFARHFFSCEHKIIFIAIAATTRINSFVFDAAASCWFPSFFFFFKHIIWSSFNGKWCLTSTTVTVLANSRKCFNPVCNCLNFSYIPEWLKKMNSKKPKTDRQ